VASGLAGEQRCVAVDLPAHGGTSFTPADGSDGSGTSHLSMEAVSEALASLVKQICGQQGGGGALLIGYSMGARIALHMVGQCKLNPGWPRAGPRLTPC
jgi:pimeloyl-ACP methyl ester carboxylesterase